MSIFQGIILGVLQGLAEFIPVSSSGHLLVLRTLMNINENAESYLVFDILLHVATLLVVLIYFWKDWLEILKNPFKSKTLFYLFIASLPAFFAVIFFDNTIDYLSSGAFLGFNFIITGILLIIAQLVSKKSTNTTVKSKNALSMGVAQILGLLPGVSRSGSTIFGGVLSGLDKSTSAKFSFMMSAPAILGSLIYALKKAISGNYLNEIQILPTLFGMFAAFIFGFFAIKFMMKIISRINLKYFAAYAIILGILVLIRFRFGLLVF